MIDELKFMGSSMKSDDFETAKNTSFLTGVNFHENKDAASTGGNSLGATTTNQDFFEKYDLQGTKSLGKYDCWDDDLTPEEWVNKCNENPEVTHARCPFYENEKYVWLSVKV